MTYVTPAEARVLRLLAEGYTQSETAVALCVAVDTVKTHCRRVCARLGARSTLHAVMLAYKAGMLEPKPAEPMAAVVRKPMRVPKPRGPQPGSKARPYDHAGAVSKHPAIAWGEAEWFAVLRADRDVYFGILEGIRRVSSRGCTSAG